jgi:ferrous iron transport protein B
MAVRTANLKIGIAGNPNSGKTTVFNSLTESRQRVGNWPGVTVDKKWSAFQSDAGEMEVVDLPGIYSLDAWSEDERVAREYILSHDAQLILNVVDSTNLERNLYLTRQLQELGVPYVILLNMMDLAYKAGIKMDQRKLAAEFQVPVYAINGTDKEAVQKLKKDLVKDVYNAGRADFNTARWPQILKEEIDLLAPALENSAAKMNQPAPWLALKLIENDPVLVEKVCADTEVTHELLGETRQRIKIQSGLLPDELIAEQRYQDIEKIRDKVLQSPKSKNSFSEKLDSILLHRIWGFPIFLLVMYMVFWSTINLGGAFIDFFDIAFGALFVDGMAQLLGSIGAPEGMIGVVAYGVGGGIQTLATFVPIIFSLFLIIAFLENTGYMARAAFVMDRLMRAIGLPGKAFIPLLIGFGCTVPAVMATRALESKRDRILTIFMAPFMSCGARLPVYVLFAAAFFPGQAQNMVFLLYLTGVVLAILTGLLLKKTVFKGKLSPYIMELPSYHKPRVKQLFSQASFKLKGFLKKGGKVLLPIIAVLGILNSVGTDGSFGNEDSEKSVLSSVGRSITPAFEPMGIKEDNWPAAVGLFTGLFAKEVIVGTLNSLYIQEDSGEEREEEGFSLGAALSEAFSTIPANLAELGGSFTDPLGISVGEVDEASAIEDLELHGSTFLTMRNNFDNSPAAAFAYLLFVLLYIPCVVAVAATFKEVGKFIGVLQIIYATVLGWSLAVIYYQVREGGSTYWISAASILLVAVIGVIILSAKKYGSFAERIEVKS